MCLFISPEHTPRVADLLGYNTIYATESGARMHPARQLCPIRHYAIGVSCNGIWLWLLGDYLPGQQSPSR
jgi:hypothetical protein